MHVLHHNNLLFEDLCAPNAIPVEQGAETKGKLADFDWWGTEVEARYPFGINEVFIE